MKFHFFTKGDKKVPSSRYRAYYMAEALVDLGYEAIVTPADERSVRGLIRYMRLLYQVGLQDVLYLQRTVYNKYFIIPLLIARLSGRRFVMDIDDAVYEHSPRKTTWLVRQAEFVTCGSEKIQEWCLRHNKNSFVLTNSVPLSIYTMRPKEPSGVPVIGWIGSLPHVFLPPILAAIEEMGKKGIFFEFRIIGAMGDQKIRELVKDIPQVTIIDALNWEDPNEAVTEIKKFIIGVMPLTTASWDQMKYFKALEYMACGVPVVASPGQTVRALLKQAGCGLIASNTPEWVETLSLLLRDAELRIEEARKGRAAIEHYFSSEAAARSLLQYVKNSRSTRP
jgi:glycosyltransferase involved in cell wall biosynthesis